MPGTGIGSQNLAHTAMLSAYALTTLCPDRAYAAMLSAYALATPCPVLISPMVLPVRRIPAARSPSQNLSAPAIGLQAR
eukprot:3025357-Rhodomonas_salina.1